MPVSEFEKDVIDRLGRIETKLDNDFHALHGNGKPGLIEKVADLEAKVSLIMQKSKWYKEWLGWIVATGLAVAGLLMKKAA
jgi:hypothetical protein